MATNNSIDSSIPIVISNGGTGATTLTDHGVLVGSGTAAITALTVGTTGQLLTGVTGSDPAFAISSTGDFTFTSSTASQTRILTVENTDNTGAATSAARVDITVGGANVADPQTNYVVSVAQTFAVGIDNSDSDKFKIAASATLGSSDVFISTIAGEITKPLQPVFLVLAEEVADVTGDATTYTINWDDEIFDTGSNFSGTTFTAPVTGRYRFDVIVGIGGITSSHTAGNVNIITSNRSYFTSYTSPAAAQDSSNLYSFQTSVFADMDLADTATVTVRVSDGTKVIDIETASYFSGVLVC